MSIYKKFMIAAMTVIVFAAALTVVIPMIAADAGQEAAEGFVQGVQDNTADAVRAVGVVADSVLTDELVDSTNLKLQELAGGIGSALRTLKDSITGGSR